MNFGQPFFALRFTRLCLLAVLIALVPCATRAAAAAAQPQLLVQNDLTDLRPGDATGYTWTAMQRTELPNSLCAALPDAAARMALTSRRLTRYQRDACTASAGGELTEWLIGRRALIAMTSGTSFPLTSDILYRALASSMPGADGAPVANRIARWRDVDPSLPDAPIRVLLPPASSIEYRILTEIILYEGCVRRGDAGLPKDPFKRLALCTTVRTDAAVTPAIGKSTVASWLRGKGNGAVALIGIATLLAEPELETALPLDGVAPSFANIADGQYKAVLPVYLQIIMPPHTASAVAAIAEPLLAESAIGPLGRLPRDGLAPLDAAERVKLRLVLRQERGDDAD